MGMMISHDMLLGRWRLSLELFGRVFMEDVGAEPGSVQLYLGIKLDNVFIVTKDTALALLCFLDPHRVGWF